MLGIAEKVGSFGANAGTGLGGVLGGALGMVGDALSAPRRMLWNAVGLPDSGAEALSNWTGMDKESLPAQGLGMLLEAALDPLTYAGGLVGRLGGKAAGALAGGKLEAQALARGPGYAGGIEKLAPALEGKAGFSTADLIAEIKKSPQAAQILGEIPEGSRYLGGGAEGFALKTPVGDVVRIGQNAGRPAIPEMAQATRSVKAGPFSVERVPLADKVGNMERDWLAKHHELGHSIIDQGFNPIDLHTGNVGRLGGKPMVIDPGAVIEHDPNSIFGKAGIYKPMPVQPQIESRARGGLGDRILDLMDADKLVQEHIARQADPTVNRLGNTVARYRDAVARPPEPLVPLTGAVKPSQAGARLPGGLSPGAAKPVPEAFRKAGVSVEDFVKKGYKPEFYTNPDTIRHLMGLEALAE